MDSSFSPLRLEPVRLVSGLVHYQFLYDQHLYRTDKGSDRLVRAQRKGARTMNENATVEVAEVEYMVNVDEAIKDLLVSSYRRNMRDYIQ